MTFIPDKPLLDGGRVMLLRDTRGASGLFKEGHEFTITHIERTQKGTVYHLQDDAGRILPDIRADQIYSMLNFVGSR